MTLRVFYSAILTLLLGNFPVLNALADTNLKQVNKEQETPPSCHCCVFDEAPLDINSEAQISPSGEPGEPLVISGTVYQSDGKTPAADTVMYFYHTDSKGIYSKRGNEPRDSLAWWHGYHRGWLKTDSAGRYRLKTIKPAPYPDNSEPAHIHAAIKSPSQKTCYNIAEFVFSDDKLLKQSYWDQTDLWWRRLGISEPSNYGGVKLKKNEAGVWNGQRDIKLFKEFDYPKFDSGRQIGEQSPAFEPFHVWGPDKGSRACPMCVYGSRPGVLFWLNSDSDWENSAKLVQWLDGESERRGKLKFKAYFLYMNPGRLKTKEIETKLTAFAQKLNLKHVAVTFVPSPDDPETSALNEINPNVKNTIIVFKKRRVVDKFTEFNPTELNLNLLKSSIDRAEESNSVKIARPVFQHSFELNNEGFVLAKVIINGQEAVAKLDTGSASSIEISTKFAERLFTTKTESGSLKTNPSKKVNLESIRIGDYPRRNQTASINEPLFKNTTGNNGFDVILGWTFLSQHFFVIDYPNRKINISEGPIDLGTSKMSFNYRLIEGAPFVEGSFGKIKTNARISTGNSGNELFSEPAAKDPLIQQKEINIEGYRITADWHLKKRQPKNCPKTGCEAVIGFPFLNRYAIYFDKNTQTVSFF